MIDVCVKQTEPMNVAFISMQGAYEQIPQAMSVLYGFTRDRNLMPIGAPHAVYLTMPDECMTSAPSWELWAPIANDVTDSAPDEQGLGLRSVAGKLVASTMYRGPYEAIAPVYAALREWIPENGYEMAGPPEEIYFSDPNDVPADEYVTEIQFPIVKG